MLTEDIGKAEAGLIAAVAAVADRLDRVGTEDMEAALARLQLAASCARARLIVGFTALARTIDELTGDFRSLADCMHQPQQQAQQAEEKAQKPQAEEQLQAEEGKIDLAWTGEQRPEPVTERAEAVAECPPCTPLPVAVVEQEQQPPELPSWEEVQRREWQVQQQEGAEQQQTQEQEELQPPPLLMTPAFPMPTTEAPAAVVAEEEHPVSVSVAANEPEAPAKDEEEATEHASPKPPKAKAKRKGRRG